MIAHGECMTMSIFLKKCPSYHQYICGVPLEGVKVKKKESRALVVLERNLFGSSKAVKQHA